MEKDKFMFNPLLAARAQQAQQAYGLTSVSPIQPNQVSTTPTVGFNFTALPSMPGQDGYSPTNVMNGGVPVQSQTAAIPWSIRQVPQVGTNSSVTNPGGLTAVPKTIRRAIGPQQNVQAAPEIGPQQTTQAAPEIGGPEIGPSRDLMNSPAGGGWFDNWDMQGVAQGVSAATGLAQAYLGFQGLSDARDLASQAQINWDKNFAMQTDAYETNKANQARTRASLNA